MPKCSLSIIEWYWLGFCMGVIFLTSCQVIARRAAQFIAKRWPRDAAYRKDPP